MPAKVWAGGKFVLLQGNRHDHAVQVGPVRPEEHGGMVFQGPAHHLDLGRVVVDPRIESATEDGPAQVGNQIDGEPAPPGGEFVEHGLGLLDARTGDLGHALDEARRLDELIGDQVRGLVGRSEQTQFDPLDRQRGPSQDVLGEILRSLADGVLLPLLTHLGHRGRLAGDDPGARRVLLQDCALQHHRRPVGLAARDQAGELDPGGQPARHPRTPAPGRRCDPRRRRVRRRVR